MSAVTMLRSVTPQSAHRPGSLNMSRSFRLVHAWRQRRRDRADGPGAVRGAFLACGGVAVDAGVNDGIDVVGVDAHGAFLGVVQLALNRGGAHVV